MVARRHAVRVAIWLAFGLAGCGGKPAPSRPAIAQATLDRIAEAERQEQLRHHQRAELLYRQAKREAPDDASRAHAAFKYGETLLHWGETERARRQLNEAIELAEHPLYWHRLGFTEFAAGNNAEAEAAFRRSIELAPNSWMPRRDLAALLARQRRWREVIAVYQAMLELELPAEIRASIEETLPKLRKELELEAAGAGG